MSRIFQRLKPGQRLLPAQQQIIEAQFQLNSSPNAQTRREIAQRLNVDPHRVKIWFRNRRIKLRGSVSRDVETRPLPILLQKDNHSLQAHQQIRNVGSL